MSKNAASEPRHLSRALSELIAVRGLARVRGEAQLTADWLEASGQAIAAQTKVMGIKRGVLQVDVSNSALLGELVSFQKISLMESLHERRPELAIRDIKFRLNGRLGGGG